MKRTLSDSLELRDPSPIDTEIHELDKLSSNDSFNFTTEDSKSQISQLSQPQTRPSTPDTVNTTPSPAERINQIKEIRQTNRKKLLELADDYKTLPESIHLDPVFQAQRNAVFKTFEEPSHDAIKYIEKSQGINGVRILRERKDTDRIRALTALKHKIEAESHGESDIELHIVKSMLSSAQKISEDTQRIYADQESRRIVNQRKYQEKVSEIRKKIETIRKESSQKKAQLQKIENLNKQLERTAKDIDRNRQKKTSSVKIFEKFIQEKARLETQIAEERENLKKFDKTIQELIKQVSSLEDFDKKLRESYEGLDPYPARFGKIQKSIDYLQSFFTDVDTRPSPADLLIEYSLATHELEHKTQSYRAAFEELWKTDLKTFKSRAGNILGDMNEFVNNHPVLASQMVSQLAYIAIFMTGDSSAGIAIQKAIARKRYEYRAMDLIRGKGYEHQYVSEFEKPLSVAQVALLDFLSKAPYLMGAVQGVREQSWGAKIGANIGRTVGWITGLFAGPASVAAGDYIGRTLGGIAGGVGEVIAQNVLAESIDRDLEVWASALSFSLSEANIGQVREGFQTLFQELNLNTESINNLATAASITFKFMKPGFRAFSQRGQAEKMYNTLNDLHEKGLLTAVKGSAQRSHTGKGVSEAFIPEIAEPGLAAINLFKFFKAFRVISESQFKEIIKQEMGSFYDFYDKLKFLEAKPGHILQGSKPILSQFLDVETIAWLDKHKADLASIPAEMINTLRSKAKDEAAIFATFAAGFANL